LRFKVSRYTEKQTFKIINNTGTEIGIIAKIPNDLDQNISLLANLESCHIFEVGATTPNESIALYFKPIEKD
jgi:hypothetical protein